VSNLVDRLIARFGRAAYITGQIIRVNGGKTAS
jgi:hypothetical protein